MRARKMLFDLDDPVHDQGEQDHEARDGDQVPGARKDVFGNYFGAAITNHVGLFQQFFVKNTFKHFLSIQLKEIFSTGDAGNSISRSSLVMSKNNYSRDDFIENLSKNELKIFTRHFG